MKPDDFYRWKRYELPAKPTKAKPVIIIYKRKYKRIRRETLTHWQL